MSLEPGWTTVRVIAAATAASTALPPRRNTASPALAARGWLVATAPRGAYNGLRVRLGPGTGPFHSPRAGAATPGPVGVT